MYYDHLFGTNYRTDPYGKQTHDEEDLFGSLKEYFDEMSYGDLTITGDIINPHPDPDATPTFVTLTQTKAYWEGQSISPAALLNAALAVSGYSISGYDKIVVIYAGRGGGSGLHPAASGYPFKSGYFVYQIHEKTSSDRGRTQTLGTFEGIGTHCHEFGHLLGLPDMQIDSATWPGGLREFDLMANGNQGFMDGNHDNTSIGGYHAPTPLSGWGKLVLGWATYTDIATD